MDVSSGPKSLKVPHPTCTPEGTDLPKDKGTRVRDQSGVPVMLGTSGSSSDAVLATLYGAELAGVEWTAPGLDRHTAMTAMVDLGLQFFRTKGSGPIGRLASRMNEVRDEVGLPPKEDVQAHEVFSHSYAEIYAGVNLTLEGIAPADQSAVEKALIRFTKEAKAHLDAVKADLEPEEPDATRLSPLEFDRRR